MIEPFAGSGAVFLNTDYERYLLGDINLDLINLYQRLKTDGEDFTEYAGRWFSGDENNKIAYYHWREHFNNSEDSREKSALFLYLNRHGYNGLCRYNLSGKFNVPFGRYKRPYFPEAEMLAFSHRAKRAVFVCCGFAELMDRARKNDVVYCDPPYVPLSDTANFSSYTKQGFNMDSQQRLAEKAQRLSQRGINVLLSNHENVLTKQLYQQAEISRFAVSRTISCKVSHRNKVIEILALYRGC